MASNDSPTTHSKGPASFRSLSILIVGSGIFGITAALELHRRGHQVTILDPGPLPTPSASSTDISKAVRMDYGADEFYTALMETALAGWAEWNRRWGRELYHPTGMLFMSREELRPGGFEYESSELIRKRGHSLERIRSVDLRERYPKWNHRAYPDGYFNPNAGWAESGEVVHQLVEEAKRAGVTIREGTVVDGFLKSGSKVEGIKTDEGEEIRSHLAVVACGAWTPTLLPHLRKVMWSVGQPILHFRPKNPETYHPPEFPVWGADVSRTGWYGFPANSEGIVKVANHGAGYRLDPDPSNTVPPSEEERFRTFLRGTFPDLAEAELAGTRLCYYCDTWDGHFWIDRDPEVEGLVVAAGGSGHAFKFAPVLGTLIADAVEGKPNPYLARFHWREPGEISQAAGRAT